jgi:Ca2+-binding EF-hand superfamily protein
MVDREEFIIFLLVALQKVDQELIDELKAIFAALDRNGNGKLEKDDLVALNERPTWTDLQRRVSRRNIE